MWQCPGDTEDRLASVVKSIGVRSSIQSTQAHLPGWNVPVSLWTGLVHSQGPSAQGVVDIPVERQSYREGSQT